MEYRGPILLVFGASLIMSPIAVNIGMGSGRSYHKPTYIVTDAASNTTCASASMLSLGGTPGCRASTGNVTTHRVMEGGATFVSARR